MLVAVPDTEATRWPSKGALEEVCNVDEAPMRVDEGVAQYRRLAAGPGLLAPEQRRRLAQFLCTKHKPALRPGH